MIGLVITFLIGVFFVFSAGSQAIGETNFNYGQTASLDHVKSGSATQEPSSTNLAAAPINYDFYFDVLDRYIAERINGKKGSIKGNASAIYPGYLNINHPKKTLAACIDWGAVKSTLPKGKIAPYAFSVRYGPSKDKVQSEALEQCKKNTNHPEVDCQCEIVAFGDELFLNALVKKSNQRKILDTFNVQLKKPATPPLLKPLSTELKASQQKSEKLEAELVALKAQQQERRQAIEADSEPPLIDIISVSNSDLQGIIQGRVSDNTGIAELQVDGRESAVDDDGNFIVQTYLPMGGMSVKIVVSDVAGLTTSIVVPISRSRNSISNAISFDSLNPLGRTVANNKNALALIIGIDNYEATAARAAYADSDAEVFADFALKKLGISATRIKTLVNDEAGERELLLSVKSWLFRLVKQNDTDVYIFFAGHGLSSDNGKKMYLLPYDGAPELLDKTAILRDELFSELSKANPRSVTVFLDTCYSGTTRGNDTLIASRPIAIRAKEKSIPDNFTVMTAAAGDQTAKLLEEAKHGMFSYFLMKGMEGEADANKDNQITAGELHDYVEENVVQQSSGSQTPELQGDASRVLVRFQ